MRGYVTITAALCRELGWPEPLAEYRFAPPRRWRFDLAWPLERVAVEVQGGTFAAGRHVRGASLLAEYEKLNAATVDGWTVLLVIPRQLLDGTLTELLARVFERRGPVPCAAGTSSR
jgi:hypothetical protein